jgi:hypothetical protein
MNKKQALYKTALIVFILFSLLIVMTTTAAMAASVTLRWDPVSGSPDGYRVFARKSGQAYNYSQVAWQGTTVTCSLSNLQDQTEYYFVVRAFDGSVMSGNSNEVHYVPPVSNNSTPTTAKGLLDPRFAETTITGGVEYYTDRSYQLTGVPSWYDNMDAIITPNDDRNRTDASGYLTFTMPYAATVCVAYDSRATRVPNWMSGFINTGDVLKTSLSSQPSLKIYSRSYAKGATVNFGANKAAGFAGGTVSNYLVFYGNSSGSSGGGTTTTGCELSSTFDESTMAVGAFLYTDRDYYITGGVPDWMLGRMSIQTPNDERNNTASSGYVNFTNPVSYWVYVLFDSRSSSIPSWLSGWELRTEYRITTSLSSQPYLKVYRKMFNAGTCVSLGGNYGPGSSKETRSNYMVVYGK